MDNKLVLPAIIIYPDYKAELLASYEGKIISNKMSLKKGALVNEIIIDSTGTVYKSLSVHKIKNLYPIWRFEFFNPMIVVHIEVKQLEKLNIETLRERLLNIIEKNKKMLISGGIEIHELRRQVELVKSIPELMLLVCASF